MAVGGAPGRERSGLAAEGLPLGDWIFPPGSLGSLDAPGDRLGSRRRAPPGLPTLSELPALSGEAGRAIPPNGPPAAEEVEPELVRLVCAVAPTRRVLCALAARAVKIRSASRLGFARTRDQARERHGLSARSLQELARVHRVLAHAPALDVAFQAGGLGWTALRSLARLERIEDEALWIRRAGSLPLRELERAVCAARRTAEATGPLPAEDADEEADACVPVACARHVRAKWALGRELARRVAGGRLPRWACAEVVAAEASSAAPPGPETPCDLDEPVDPGASLGDWVVRRQAPAVGPEDTKHPEDAEDPEDAEGAVDPEHAALAGDSESERFGAREVADDEPTANHAGGAGEARIADEGEGRPGCSATGASGPEAPPNASAPASPPELPPGLARLLAGLEEADAFEVDRRLQRALARERTHEARIGPLLRCVLEARLYRRQGYWERDRYLEERLGLCPRKARALVRIERVLARAPELARAYRAGVLSWVQTQALAPLLEAGVGPRHASAWVDRARSVTVRRLQDDVREALMLADLDAARFARTGGLADGSADPTDPKEVEMEIKREERKIRAHSERAAEGGAERQTRAHPDPAAEGRVPWQTRAPTGAAPDGACEEATISFHAPAESARFFRAVLEEVRERLARARSVPVSEGEAFEAMLDHAIAVWSQRDARVRRDRRIFERDGWRCAVPGCTSHRNLQVHHVVFRSHGGGDEPENRITLCAWHHQRGVHGGLVRITGRAPDRLRFELGLRDGEPPLMVYESGDRIVR